MTNKETLVLERGKLYREIPDKAGIGGLDFGEEAPLAEENLWGLGNFICNFIFLALDDLAVGHLKREGDFFYLTTKSSKDIRILLLNVPNSPVKVARFTWVDLKYLEKLG